MSPPSRARVLAALGLLVSLALPDFSWAEPRSEREYQLKAAFVYNFTKFVEWPEDAPAASDDNTVLCVLADEFVHEVVRGTVQGKSVNGRTIEVKSIDSSKDVAKCHLVFVGASQRSRLKNVKKRVESGGILVVSEAPGYGQEIAMINLVVDQNKVRFEIDMSAADRARLRISSKLLKLAKIVGERPTSPGAAASAP